MENKVTSPVPAAAPIALPLSVIEARNNVVSNLRGVYGAKKKYAVELNNMMTFAWYSKDAEKSPLIEAERQNLMAALKAIDHTNPHKIWGDVKGYALEDAQDRGLFGEVKPVEDAKPAEGESTGGANINAPRSPRVRYIDELTTLYSFGEREKAFLPDDLREVHLLVSKALGVMKVDLAKIKIGK